MIRVRAGMSRSFPTKEQNEGIGTDEDDHKHEHDHDHDHEHEHDHEHDHEDERSFGPSQSTCRCHGSTGRTVTPPAGA
jgi:ABC-type Zn2+ transport system substrate-binding protein/surface adhesin